MLRGKLWAGALLVAGAVLAITAGDAMAQGGRGPGKGPGKGGKESPSLEKQIEQLKAQIKDLETQLAKLSPAKSDAKGEAGKGKFGKFDAEKFKEMAKKFGGDKKGFGGMKGFGGKKGFGGPFGKGKRPDMGKGGEGKGKAPDMAKGGDKGKGKGTGMERGKGRPDDKKAPTARPPMGGSGSGASVTRALDDLQRSLDSLRKALEKK